MVRDPSVDPRPAGSGCVTRDTTEQSGSDGLAAGVLERLLAAIDERLRIQATLDLPDASAVLSSDGMPDSLPTVDEALLVTRADLQVFAAPLFDPARGGRLIRAGKVVLNVPLRLLGTPQRYFNDVLRRIVASWSDVLRASLATQAALLRELAAQRDRIDHLAVKLRELETALGREPAASAPPHLAPEPPSPGAPPSLRIGLLSRTYPPRPDVGGIARYTRDLAHALAELGHQVHVFTESRLRLRRDGPRLFVHGLCPDILPVVPDLPMTDRRLRWSLAVARCVTDLARAGERLDVVESQNWDSEGVALQRSGMGPVVVRVTTPLTVTARHAGWPASADLDASVQLERWLIANASGVTYATEAVLETARDELSLEVHGNLRCARIPLGVPPAPPGPQPSDPGRRLLFVGRLERRKGIGTLLAVVPSLLRRYRDLLVDIVGDDTIAARGEPTPRERFEAAHELRFWRRRCRFRGVVDEDRLQDFYRSCTVFVAPSLYESFGLVYLEAMRWGKPVIGCRAGGIPEVVRDGETGLLVPPDDPVGLEAAITRLLDDPELRQRLGERAREALATEFSSRRMAERTAAFYAGVLGCRATERAIA